jgi:2-polyprenyl-6-methoxyphenol hydroxylase-like FAD-dependent oxidoreductase
LAGVARMRRQKVVIIGGSITGLTGALALEAEGFDVTIVERDPSPDASLEPANSNTWTRRGALHALQPHVLTARLRNKLHEWYPDLVRDLLDAGAWEQPFEETIHPDLAPGYHAPPGAEAISVLMARRTTLELVMRRHVERRGVAAFLAGKQVSSLIIDGDTAPITVRGVRIRDVEGERELLADVVIDASGRTTRFADQLRKDGALISDEYHTSNTVYYARHYRLKPGGSFPRTYGLPGVMFGDMVFAALPADNGAMVVTLSVFKDDPLLYEAVGRLEVFEEIARRTPRVAAWVDPSVSEPTSAVMSWANMDFLWRTTIADGAPQILGFFFAGDATIRSNPKYGRGCTCGTIGSHILAETLASVADPADRPLHYEATLFETFRKEWEDLLAVDRRDYGRFQATAGIRPASLGETLQWRLQDHVLRRAMVVDPNVQRKIMKGFYGLEDATAWTKDPVTWLRIAAAGLPIHARDMFKEFSIRPSRQDIKALIDTPVVQAGRVGQC